MTTTKIKNEDKNPSQNQQGQQEQRSNQQGGAGFLGGLGDKLNSAAGGRRESEKNEDMLDKGRSLAQFILRTSFKHVSK